MKRDRSEDTLHGAFFDITVDSSDAQIKKISHMRVRQSLEVANQLGIKGVVFHTNYITNFRMTTYREHWLTENEKFYRTVLAEYPMLSNKAITILESMAVEGKLDGELIQLLKKCLDEKKEVE